MLLSSQKAKRCATVSGWCVHEGKVLLVKHKKLGFWLAPGGHIEENELPHEAAQREFWEETGIQGQVVSAVPMLQATNSEFLPMPFLCNLHTINKPRGTSFCEQHYVFLYFIRVVGSSALKRQLEEVDDIGWFDEKELQNLDTREDIKHEAAYVFDHFPVTA